LEQLDARFGCVPQSVGQARALLRQLPTPLSSPDADVVGLVVSELVANAVRHGCSPGAEVGVQLVRAPGWLRAEVTQPGPLFDPQEVARRRVGQARGWGLLIVERLSRSWGVDPARRCVWAEIPVDGQPAAPPQVAIMAICP
jgi:anti-sigma regulatory factor (Ser/Thr protein kinase)